MNQTQNSIQTKDFQTVNIDYQVMYSVPAKYVINNKVAGTLFKSKIKVSDFVFIF
mgnify:CR=1 FL=1